MNKLIDYSMFMVIEHLSEPEFRSQIPNFETYNDDQSFKTRSQMSRISRTNKSNNTKSNSMWKSIMNSQNNKRKNSATSALSAMTVLGPGLRNTVLSYDGMIKYHFGIIDYLQYWNIQKRAERFYKSKLLQQNESLLSCAKPSLYRERFT